MATPLATPFLQLEHIVKRFGGLTALNDVSLALAQGEVACLVGENGSGKSTLIKIISGMYTPDAGVISIDGQRHTHLRAIDSIREGIQVIYQDFSLFPNLSVAENIAVNEAVSAGWFLVNWTELRARAAQALARINVQLDLDAPAGTLPVVDRQLIAIAKALLQNARLIIMDEPTTALSQREIRSLFDVIRTLKAAGIGTLFVSHKLDEIIEIADRTIIIRNGEIVVDRPARELTRGAMIRAMTGRDLEDEALAAAPPAHAAVALQVEGLTCRGHFYDVSLHVRAGEVLGITGLLGSGRTGLALSLFGMLPPDSGRVTVDGRPASLHNVQSALEAGIGYVPEDRIKEGLFLPQPIGHNVVVRVIDELAAAAGVLDRGRMAAAVSQWVDRLRIKTPSAALPVTSLSGGNQQRVVLARWLATTPKVMILNGPTVGVDVGSKQEIHEIIRGLAAQGMAICIISDDVPELLQICHRIHVMKRGRIVSEFTPGRISEVELNAMLIE
ncbi:MAG: sugar ABC transporter ATP-binding protein [Caldilineaceae bacterium]|nr:sugar ABC transporter ATP-binding protein [Caldilineaceae bacterium]